ncbi:hypothetical protein ACLM5H_24635 [Fredinandcohnia humi]
MRELMRQYQEGKNREVIEKVLKLVETDLKEFRYKGEAPKEIDGLFFIAYRIRAFMLNNCLKWTKAKNLTEKSFRADDYNELQGYIEGLYENSHFCELNEYGKPEVFYSEFDADSVEYDEYDFNFAEIRQNNFTSIRNNFDEVASIFPYSYVRVIELTRKFEDLRIESEEFQTLYKEVKSEHLPMFIEALEIGLQKVDLSRTDKEIVKFVNKVMLTQFIKMLRNKTGEVRIYDTQTKKDIFVKPKFGVNAGVLLIGKSSQSVEKFERHLTKKQYAFITEVLAVVEEDLKSENVQAFKWNKDGSPKVNKSYLAGKVGKSEANFKQTLKRVEKAIHENWNK